LGDWDWLMLSVGWTAMVTPTVVGARASLRRPAGYGCLGVRGCLRRLKGDFSQQPPSDMSYVVHLEGHDPFSVEADDMTLDPNNDQIHFSDSEDAPIEDLYLDLNAVEAILPRRLWNAM